jgi:hypothetical protein
LSSSNSRAKSRQEQQSKPKLPPHGKGENRRGQS